MSDLFLPCSTTDTGNRTEAVGEEGTTVGVEGAGGGEGRVVEGEEEDEDEGDEESGAEEKLRGGAEELSAVDSTDVTIVSFYLVRCLACVGRRCHC